MAFALVELPRPVVPTVNYLSSTSYNQTTKKKKRQVCLSHLNVNGNKQPTFPDFRTYGGLHMELLPFLVANLF